MATTRGAAADLPVARDLLVAPSYEGNSWGSLDLVPDPPGAPARETDLATAVGPLAMRQALLLRLLTPLGALADLGHPDYGSRLHELLGELHTPAARDLARAFTLRAVLAEPRVESVVSLQVRRPDQFAQQRVEILLTVQARGIDEPVALGIEVAE
jgi:phage baseplate assembly protein W